MLLLILQNVFIFFSKIKCKRATALFAFLFHRSISWKSWWSCSFRWPKCLLGRRNRIHQGCRSFFLFPVEENAKIQQQEMFSSLCLCVSPVSAVAHAVLPSVPLFSCNNLFRWDVHTDSLLFWHVWVLHKTLWKKKTIQWCLCSFKLVDY